MVQKLLFCFCTISDEILQHILGYSFCTKRNILVHFFQMLMQFKAAKIFCAKAALCWHQKMLVALTPGANIIKLLKCLKLLIFVIS
jgi:hypothetical protein